MRSHRLLFVLAVIGLTAASAVTRSAQNPEKPGGGACRIAPTVFTTAHANSFDPLFHATTQSSCRFAPSTLTFSCTIRYSDSKGFSSTTTTAAVYESLDDVLAEATAIPPLKRLATITAKTTGQAGGGTTRFTYDAQRRIVKESSPATTINYSAWDPKGRPRVARGTGSNGASWEVTYSYNDAARSQTMTNSQRSTTTTCVQSFDANGNPTTSVCTSTLATAAGTTATTRITATERICR